MEPVVIQKSKTKTLLLILLSVVIAVAMVFALVYPLEHPAIFRIPLPRPIYFGLILLALGGCLFAAIKGATMLLDNSPALILNEEGIQDFTNLKSVGLIRWQDIELITEAQIMANKFVCLHLSNPDNYLANMSGWKRRSAQSNAKILGTYFALSAMLFKIQYADFVDHVRRFWQQAQISRN